MVQLYRSHSLGTASWTRFSRLSVEACWHHGASGSRLRQFFLDTFAQHWIFEDYMQTDRDKWEAVFDELPDLRREMLRAVGGICADRSGDPVVRPLGDHLERLGEGHSDD